jgi:hypothetical protein
MDGYASIVAALVAAGADLEAMDRVRGGVCVGGICDSIACVSGCLQRGRTPLGWAQSRGHAEVIAQLQAAAAAAPASR